jgi:hypothetical protein
MLSGKQEGTMSDRWVKCTDLKGNPSYINLGEAIAMNSRMMGGEVSTTIMFQRSSAEVRETPEQILGLKAL